ncbi:MAG: hypothetical protein F6K04_05545 [Leptolyngbya sp. SIO4C5]|nr:hypothetical protein [Leptolyngbya sp. SIO4C5]
MSLSEITEALILDNASAQSFERGEDLYASGSVSEVTQRGTTIYAAVQGSQYEPYQVVLEPGRAAHCSCPYDWGGWCKHIVATALVCLHQAERVEIKPTLAQLLDQLNPLQTQDLVQTMVDIQPDLVELVDCYVNRVAS